MCGGVRFHYDPTYESDLADVYSGSQLAHFRESGLVESLFWQPRPVLPVVLDGQIQKDSGGLFHAIEGGNF